jgi:uncharacterized protein with FMN-binding domain
MIIAAVVLAAAAAPFVHADTLESTTGITVQGKLISRDDKQIVFEVQAAGRSVQRKYPIKTVKALTVNNKREVLQPDAPAAPTVPAKAAQPAPRAAPAAGSAKEVQRTRQEVEALIAEAGKTPPDWLGSTPLNVPATLDLSFPEKAEGDWNNQKNVGQFVWDVVNPNPGRWREGVKLMHHLMELHKDDPDKVARASADLGGMYHRLFQDYARAAYWWRKSGGWQDPVGVAECYWKLGNKQMAVQLLNGLRRVPVSAIKLWADMGETAKAIKMVDLFARGPGAADAFLMAGDACRLAGRYTQAVQYYERTIAAPDDERNKRSKDRARASLEAIRLFDTLDVSKVADGTYAASSLGYEAQVAVEVTVRGGRIENVKVTEHREKQFYAALTDTPRRIIAKQSVKGVDATSRATITSEAIINASAKALRDGMKEPAGR